MRSPCSWFLILCLLGMPLVMPCAGADEQDAALTENLKGLSGKAALAYVAELATDAMKGRKSGFEGGALVENWMLAKMSAFGLHPADAGGTYLEPFTYGACNTSAPIALSVGGKKLTYATDYFDLTYTGSGTVEAEAAFVGYGISRPDLGWDDYADLDVQGKIVIAIRGAPRARALAFQKERYIGSKTSTAADHGAAGLLLVEGVNTSTGTIQDRFHRAKLPALWISGAVADTIFAAHHTTLAALKATRDRGEVGKGFATGVKVAMDVHAAYVPRAQGHNALGAIRGRDPDLNEEIILVSAHMDHLGVAPDGQVFNGADDNASGVAVMMHLADILTANRFRPKRTVVFCGFGAEEQGLVGSKALAARYPFQGRIVAVLNMDMVGQGEPRVAVNGGACFPHLQQRIEGLLPASVKALADFGPHAGSSSDHWPFYERGVPAFAISTKGKHPHYHHPKDDTANIDPACLEAAARVVGSMVVKLATYDKPLTDPLVVEKYLLREGPRFDVQRFHAGKILRFDGARQKYVPYDVERDARAQGFSGVLVVISEDDEPAAAWAALVALTRAPASPYVLLRKAADAQGAWRAGKIALLPVLCCATLAGKDPASLSKLADLGYRVVRPWGTGQGGGLVKTGNEAAVLAVARKAHLLVDLDAVSVERWDAVRKALAGAPAILSTDAGEFAAHGSLRALLGPSVLPVVTDEPTALLRRGLALRAGAVVPVLVGPIALPAFADWARAQPAGWDLPGSEQRKTLRRALGGRLIEWLGRAER